jgi:hypothetical protein
MPTDSPDEPQGDATTANADPAPEDREVPPFQLTRIWAPGRSRKRPASPIAAVSTTSSEPGSEEDDS